MTLEDIYRLLEKGEHLTLECKRARSSVPGSVWETYSAFANTYGGKIFLGIDEDTSEPDFSKRFAITGVEDAKKIRIDLWNMLNNPEKVSENILKESDVDTLTIDGKDVVVITVPQAHYSQRPVFINNNPLRGSYRRNHEGDYHMSRPLINMMLRDANPDGNDGAILQYYTMDDVDMPTLQRYRNHFASLNLEHPWSGLSDKDFLLQLGGYAIDRKEGIEGLTIAGLMMFGKGLPIREKFDNLRMDYIDYSDIIGEQRYSDRLTYDGRWENNLYNFLTTVVPKLMFVLPRPFQMEGIVRKDDTIQHKAVREAFTNMIIHADLLMEGLIRVKKFDDRFELTNPGLLKLPVEQIYRGGESKARNQRIQNMLRMIGYGENIGSGFPLILKAWEDKHWQRPEIIEQYELEQTTLILRLSDTTNNGTKVEPKDETKDETKEISERQKIILDFLVNNPHATINSLNQRLNISLATLKREIAYLQKEGVLKREGGKTHGIWTIISPKS